jgi:nucleoid DNA-binding protein
MSTKRVVDRMKKALPELGEPFLKSQVELVFVAIEQELVENGRVRIPGFGTFRRVFVDTRTTRNPRTRATSTKLAHHKIKFREEKPRTPK